MNSKRMNRIGDKFLSSPLVIPEDEMVWAEKYRQKSIDIVVS